MVLLKSYQISMECFCENSKNAWKAIWNGFESVTLYSAKDTGPKASKKFADIFAFRVWQNYLSNISKILTFLTPWYAWFSLIQ